MRLQHTAPAPAPAPSTAAGALAAGCSRQAQHVVDPATCNSLAACYQRAIGARAAQSSPLWLCMPTPAPARVTPLVSAISKQAAQLSASAAGAGAAPLLVLEPAPRPPALHSPACRCLSLPAARYPFAPPHTRSRPSSFRFQRCLRARSHWPRRARPAIAEALAGPPKSAPTSKLRSTLARPRPSLSTRSPSTTNRRPEPAHHSPAACASP